MLGMSVANIATAHGLNSSLVYEWRAALVNPCVVEQRALSPRFVAARFSRWG